MKRLLSALCLAVLFSGCGDDQERLAGAGSGSPGLLPPATANTDLALLEASPRAIWVGQRFGDAPLTAVGVQPGETYDESTVTYGRCRLPENIEYGCRPPLEISVSNGCEIDPTTFDQAPEASSIVSDALIERFEDTQAFVYVGGVAVSITSDRPERIDQALGQLRFINSSENVFESGAPKMHPDALRDLRKGSDDFVPRDAQRRQLESLDVQAGDCRNEYIP